MNEYMAPEQDVVVYSRVRLARNFADTPFMSAMDDNMAKRNVDRVTDYIAQTPNGSDFERLAIKDLTASERSSLVERRLISYDTLKRENWSVALISSDEALSIMINEDDHIRIQGKLPGLQLEKAGELAFQIEKALSSRGDMAFDTQWGYLTASPTNVGTAMRAAAILHLPALMATGQINQISQAIARLGMSMRGLYAADCDAMCAMYQISNQTTLGRSEDDILRSLTAAALQVAGHERAVRDNMSANDKIGLTDRLMRSVGTLKYARIMPAREFMTRVSDLRMAAAMKLVNISLDEVDKLIVEMQPATIEVSLPSAKDQRAQDISRQNRIMEALKDV
ncbi:MAG: ATP--guanido phosphotransferase [Clostridia bacterium]|nr:ATP--guanido phosphotransferase [Clostridia bacterium]